MSRRIVITGAGSGIGQASAIALAERGYSLFLLDKDETGLVRTAEACGSAIAGLQRCDVADESAMERGLASLTGGGVVDILVNSAGIAAYGSFDAVSNSQWRRQFEVNVMGTVNAIRAVLPGMIARGRGLIINVGSRRGLEPKAVTAAYSAGKAAVHALTRSLNEEYGPSGICLSYLAPGGTKTGLASPKAPQFMEAETVGRSVAFMCDLYPDGWVRQLEVLPPGL